MNLQVLRLMVLWPVMLPNCRISPYEEENGGKQLQLESKEGAGGILDGLSARFGGVGKGARPGCP